jgi:RecJ-like exonuclease
MVNPVQAIEGEPLSGAGVAYFFAKALDARNKDLANLAVIGMVGDLLEKKIGKYYTEILKDSESIVKKGLLIYPSTRPIDKALEYSSNPYIPGVTGSYLGVGELLREAGIKKGPAGYKSSNELADEEMSNLITGIMLRCGNEKCIESLIGNIFLVKFFGKLEDARELSALINACSRLGNSNISLSFCLGNKEAMKKAMESVGM